jgi:two-component system phosphate regulon response regulator PhoB
MGDDLVVDAVQRQVLLDGHPLDLSRTELGVLLVLAKASGGVLTRREILDGLYGDRYAITDRAVDVQVASLRRKLRSAGDRIETVRGVGFRLIP